MSKKQLIAVIMFFTFALTAGSLYAQSKYTGVHHVVIVGVDGMAPFGIKNASTPNMDYLIKNGAYTPHARTVQPSSSSPNWASMIMGASPAQHGITSNDWELDDHTMPPVVTGTEDIFPTIFGVLRQQKPDAVIGAIYHWDGFGRLFEKSAVNYDYPAKDQYDAAAKAVDYIKENKPTFTFVHLDHVDHAGHTYGWGTPEYLKAVSLADSLIGLIFQAAKDAGIADDMLFLVTADHGGIGLGHGGETIDEIEIPFLLYGTGVKKDYTIKQPVYTFDNAATVAFALGIKQPYAWIGRPVKAAFEGYDEPDLSFEKAMVPPPAIFPPKRFYSPAGGLFIDKPATVEIKAVDKDDVIRYTLDGSVPTEESTQYTGPFELDKSGVVTARAFKDGAGSMPVQGFFRVIKNSGNIGLKYSYYETEGDISQIPIFENLKPISAGMTYEIRLDEIKHRDGNFAVMYEGYLNIEKDGNYKFYTYSDDGSKLYIDGKEVVDNDGSHGAKERRGEIDLKKGKVPIKVTYFNGYGGSWLEVYYRGPGIPIQIIPADKLSHD